MFSKNIIHRRGAMIAIAVIALMAMTAGTALAAAGKAKFEADGIVVLVGLSPGGTVESDFKIKKNGDIKSVEVHTVGEVVGGAITSLAPCEEKGKHSAGACGLTTAALLGSTVISVHESSAKLDVTTQRYPLTIAPGVEIEVIDGTLKGKLSANMAVESFDDSQLLIGSGKLKVRSTEGTVSTYGCLLTLVATVPLLDITEPPAPGQLLPFFGPIDACVASPGPNPLTITPPLTPPIISPVMVPVILHVTDTGSFEVADDSMKIKGKIEVIVSSSPLGTVGVIHITKGSATIGHDHPHDDHHGKKDKDDDDDDDD
ncbi:MAG: hypothetical protein O3B95_04620 [Chloroflexi bacterium]|nr:hypothetical protein [Chloroflexota bacterium]